MSDKGLRTAGLTVLDGVAILVGVVVGIGIFGFPPLVASNVDTPAQYMAVWLFGGLIMLLGALSYAELGSAYPDSGGEYHYLGHAYGSWVAMLFAWARGTVIQTGAIAAVAFIYGEYANQLIDLGAYGVGWHAIIAVVALTVLNLAGTVQSKRAQVLFTVLTLAGVLALIVAALAATALGLKPGASGLAAAASNPAGSLGMAMVFVLLTYGGWNETAYIAGELRDVRRDLSRILLTGTAIVVVLYMGVNIAYLSIFGLQGLRESHAVAADLMQIVAGPAGAMLLSLLVCLTALSTINGSILTGARVYFALGRDVPALNRLGAWNTRGLTPVNALLLQGAITLALVLFGMLSKGNSVHTMVAYTAPVFWLFMLLVAASVFVLRRRDPRHPRPFKVPLYPVAPLVFCLACAGLLLSSIRYAGLGGMLGLAVLLLGLPFVFKYGRRGRQAAAAPAKPLPSDHA